jgi:hypothetical protein
MNAITKKEIQAYANQTYRDEGFTHSVKNASWSNPNKSNGFISDDDVEAEAQAIFDLVNDGIGIKPKWMK